MTAPDHLTIRPIQPHEYAAVGELTVEAYREYGLEESGYDRVLRDVAHRAAHTLVLVAVDTGGTLLGAVAYVGNGGPYQEIAAPDEAEFRMLAVVPAARGRGVGEALVRACLERARAAGRRRLVLCTGVRMHAAQRLYARLGFTRQPVRDWSPAPGVDLLAYSRDLG